MLFTFSTPENAPAVVDAKVTVIEQLAPMPNVAGQVLPVTEKSLAFVPVIEVPVIFTPAVPVFVKVAVCAWFDVVTAAKLSEEVSDANACAPGLSAMKPVFTMFASGVTTGDAAPTR